MQETWYKVCKLYSSSNNIKLCLYLLFVSHEVCGPLAGIGTDCKEIVCVFVWVGGSVRRVLSDVSKGISI